VDAKDIWNETTWYHKKDNRIETSTRGTAGNSRRVSDKAACKYAIFPNVSNVKSLANASNCASSTKSTSHPSSSVSVSASKCHLTISFPKMSGTSNMLKTAVKKSTMCIKPIS
jgi:hypothetical protein